MAKLSSNGKYVTVQKGDTLSEIAETYLGKSAKYKQLAAINNLKNPNLIYINQRIVLYDEDAETPAETPSNKPTVTQFGLMSDHEGSDDVLFAVWTWNKEHTESYKVLWTYDTGDGIWFVGNSSTITVDEDSPEAARQSTFSIPENAERVQFKVKPISEKHKQNGTDVNYWDAEWSDVQTYTDATPLPEPGIPDVEIEKFNLTATLEGLTIDAEGIEFEVIRDNTAGAYKTGRAAIVTGYASYSCTIDVGSEYKVRCRAYKGNNYSEWSNYSANVKTMPAAVSGITEIRATSKASVYVEWAASTTADSYDLEYTTKLEYFDGSNQTTTETGVKGTHYTADGLATGEEYFFRVRAVNEDGTSGWCEPASVVLGSAPSAPTTWSSTTTAIVGEIVRLYWVHNSKDGSKQRYALIERKIDGEHVPDIIIEKTLTEDEDDPDEQEKTSFYEIDTSGYHEGTKIEWRVKTAGITMEYGDWSIQRTIDVYASPTAEMYIVDADDERIRTIEKFPFYVTLVGGPQNSNQAPIGYHISVVSNSVYETTDRVGNPMTVNNGDEVYSRYFDTFEALRVEFNPGVIDLKNNIEYTINAVISMNSGLTAEATQTFTVQWTDTTYEPNAEVGIDTETYTASIRPYCVDHQRINRIVEKHGSQYVVTTTPTGLVYGERVAGAVTTTGENVYFGTTSKGEEVYYASVDISVIIGNVLLSVYRREFDGKFTELATGLDSLKFTTIVDPHPALDLARYRIVATDKNTGAVSFYDLPGYPVKSNAVIIQWDEKWTFFDAVEESAMEQPAWSGSMLKLPYNIDVSDSNKADVTLIEYIGREHPISYYGTQLGESSTWNLEIPKSDKETLYALRRLAKWMGDVYVREPSGSGYWANVGVSFSQKHRNLTIPVTLNLTRVEGGI